MERGALVACKSSGFQFQQVSGIFPLELRIFPPDALLKERSLQHLSPPSDKLVKAIPSDFLADYFWLRMRKFAFFVVRISEFYSSDVFFRAVDLKSFSCSSGKEKRIKLGSGRKKSCQSFKTIAIRELADSKNVG